MSWRWYKTHKNINLSLLGFFIKVYFIDLTPTENHKSFSESFIKIEQNLDIVLELKNKYLLDWIRLKKQRGGSDIKIEDFGDPI